jgi:hypothetical protein
VTPVRSPPVGGFIFPGSPSWGCRPRLHAGAPLGGLQFVRFSKLKPFLNPTTWNKTSLFHRVFSQPLNERSLVTQIGLFRSDYFPEERSPNSGQLVVVGVEGAVENGVGAPFSITPQPFVDQTSTGHLGCIKSTKVGHYNVLIHTNQPHR